MIAISVIIPVYNKKQYLIKCIGSVVNSSLTNLEIICIDDFSTDGSLEKLEEIGKSDNRITILKNEKNMGAAFTRNKGIKCAAGKYIFFLDADDYIDKNTLDIYYNQMEKYCAQGCFIKFCKDDGEDKSIKQSYPSVYTGLELLDLFVKNDETFLYACGAIWKSEFLRKNQIQFRNLKIGEGGLFILEALLKADRLIVSNFRGYHYIINEASLNRSQNSMSYAALGQAKQIIYMILQLQYDACNKEIVSFIKWYLQKYVGGINNLKKSIISKNSEIFSENELLLLNLIRGSYSEKKISLKKDDENLLRKIGKVYIYGAGYETLDTIKYCNQIGVEIEKIFVSSKAGNPENIYGYHIFEFDNRLITDESIPFLITAHKKHHKQIKQLLLSSGINNVIEL